MKRKTGVVAIGMLLGLVAGQAMAQDDVFEVTLEVLDDVADVDGVVLILEEQDRRERDARSEEEDGRRRAEERDARERDEGLEGDTAESDFAGERDERREEQIEDRDLERDRDDTIIEETDVVEPPVEEPVVDGIAEERDEVMDEEFVDERDEVVDETVDEPMVDERELGATDAVGDV